MGLTAHRFRLLRARRGRAQRILQPPALCRSVARLQRTTPEQRGPGGNGPFADQAPHRIPVDGAVKPATRHLGDPIHFKRRFVHGRQPRDAIGGDLIRRPDPAVTRPRLQNVKSDGTILSALLVADPPRWSWVLRTGMPRCRCHNHPFC